MKTGRNPKYDCLLSIEEVADFCCMSIKRVDEWIAKKGLKVFKDGKSRKVSLNELLDLLVSHNMAIPDSLIPLRTRKILFVFPEDLVMDRIVLEFLVKFFEKLKKEASLIIDYCHYGSIAKMKLLVFRPDLVILYAASIEQGGEFSRVVRRSGEFEGMKMAAIVEPAKVRDSVMKSLGVDALIPRCADVQTLLARVNDLLVEN